MQVFTDLLDKYSHEKERIGVKEFEAFLLAEQKCSGEIVQDLSKFMREYLQNPERDVQEPYFTKTEVRFP